LGGEKSGRGVIFKPTDTLIKETDPNLVHSEHGGDIPTFAVGPRLFSIEKESTYRPDLHPGFPTLLSGEDYGYNVLPVPTEIMLPKWHEKFKAANPERYPPFKAEAQGGPGYYDLALGVKGEGLPSQEITEEYLTHLQKHGFKDGGAVHMKDGKLVDELINEAKKKQEAPVNPFRMPTEKQSQYEKDIRQNMANQQEARERLFSDRIPSSVGEAKDKAIGLLQGAGGALAGYGSQVAGGAGDIASLYQEFKPESFPDLPSKVQALPTTEDIQDLLREHVNPSPEFAAGISGGNAAALIQGAASLPALAKSAAKGATAGSKALANEAAYRIHQAMTTGQGPLAGALAGVAPRQLITYHGTPHRMAPTPKNPLGEFDASKIGTGEGAQAYGHGHYLAESPKVAKSYRDKLSDGFTFPGGTKLDSSALTDMGFKTPQVKAIISSLNFHQGDVAKASQTIRDNASYLRYGSAEQNSLQKAADFVSGIKANELPSSGSLYKVDLPDEQIAKMLDWDKPLSQQPPSLGIPALKALEAQQQSILSQLVPLENAGKQMTPEGNALRAQLDGIAQAVNRYHVGNKTGGDYYTQLALEMGSPKNASEALMQSGVSGIRYLDQGSRASGEGTRNFVVFPGNENMMNIVGREKDGGAIHMTGGGKVGAFKALGEILVGGAKVKVRPPSDNVANVRDANFQYPRTIGNQNVSIGDLRGGVRFDKQETQRVNQLAAKIASPEGYISRIIVDHNNNVIEGQHRLEALRKLGAKEVPVYKIEDLADTMPVAKMESAMQSVGAIHSDHVHQLMGHALEHIAEDGLDGARKMNYGAFQKFYDAALDAASRKAPQEDALRLAQERAALPVDQGGLGLPAGNTAEQRAMAMGFTQDAYHGTNADIKAFDPEKSAMGGITWFADHPAMTEEFMNSRGGANILPLRVNSGKTAGWKEYDQLGVDELAGRGYNSVYLPGKNDEGVGFVLSPESVRSRFAAFDPFRRNAAIAASMSVAAPDLLAAEPEKKAKGGAVSMDAMRLAVMNKQPRKHHG